ncbi:hypothetical protein Poly24_53920 [Rosistilla carotiformis]|uniref:Uncharacterized protein n=1 Tax=Rosistilla carotiformis TaxID=2528017 RepID=A0A518K1G0_9BACT|nr:hypothetical protein Poly24_53920 [Rosistilla carotiformis]
MGVNIPSGQQLSGFLKPWEIESSEMALAAGPLITSLNLILSAFVDWRMHFFCWPRGPLNLVLALLSRRRMVLHERPQALLESEH